MANICIISEFKIEQIQNYFQMTYLFIVSGGFRTGETICKFKRAEIKWSVINPCIQYSICSLKKVHIFSFCCSQFFLKQLNTHWMWRRWFSGVSENIRMPPRFAMENSSCPWKTVFISSWKTASVSLNQYDICFNWNNPLCHTKAVLSIFERFLVSLVYNHSLCLVQWSTLLCLANRGFHQSTASGMILDSLSV